MNLRQIRHVINARIDNNFIIDQDKFSSELNSEYLFKNKYFSKNLIIGVSGGPDSMLLSHLLNKHSKKYGLSITAVIIDHKLRSYRVLNDKYGPKIEKIDKCGPRTHTPF